MFGLRNKKTNFLVHTLIWGPGLFHITPQAKEIQWGTGFCRPFFFVAKYFIKYPIVYFFSTIYVNNVRYKNITAIYVI